MMTGRLCFALSRKSKKEKEESEIKKYSVLLAAALPGTKSLLHGAQTADKLVNGNSEVVRHGEDNR